MTPYLCVKGAADAIKFYRLAFGATEMGERMVGPDGKVGHAQLMIGDSPIMICDENPDFHILAPHTLGGSSIRLTLFVRDIDAMAAMAIAAGAVQIRPVELQFYGHRSGEFEDPFGYRWTLSSKVEDLSDEEMKNRAAEFFSKV